MLEAVILALGWINCVSSGIYRDTISKPFTASDLNWVDNQGQFLQSQSGSYILAFFNANPSDFYLSVILGSAPKQVLWTANRNIPIILSDNLVFQNDGNLVLLGPRGLPVWSTGTNGTDAQTLRLLDSGNLVVLDSKNATLWESFAHPTDTIVSGQKLYVGMRLTSSKSSTDFSEGHYSLIMNNHTLELGIDLGGGAPVPYWTLANDDRSTLNVATPPAFARISPGQLGLFANDSSETLVSALPFQQQQTSIANTTVLLILGSDGNLKSRVFTSSVQLPDVSVILDNCQLPSPCGPLGVCSSNGQCSCPQGLAAVNSNDPAQGCKVQALDFCRSSKGVQFQDLDADLSYFANRFTAPASASSLQDCKQLCMDNCSCTAGFFNATAQACYLSRTSKFGSFDLTTGGWQTFIKVAKSSRNSKQRFLIYVIVGCSLGVILLSVVGFVWWYRRRVLAARGDHDEEDGFLEAIPGLPTRFTYKQLQAATGGFSKKLGGGGFGSVYEGTLPDKSKVAVKQLESIGQGKKEFRAEVATIGSIHHVNLVRLRGFCSEGNHRLLVYEFLARGSLDKSLFRESSSHLLTDSPATSSQVVLEWETRYNIALGTARGLVYLHEDCRERIIHCDIKPENILLDENFTAKVSDFGLAKLMNREQSHVFTTMRGTRGYLAPEWLLNTAISEKSDVYSFGMVLLEIVSGRKNFDPNETSEKWYIPAYAFKQAQVGALAELLDPRLKGQSIREEEVVKTVKIALWCIQEEMHLRPSIGKVAQMLEGNIPVPDPPLSSQLAVRIHARMADIVSERDRYSIGSEFNSEDLLSASYLSGPR